MEIDQLRHFAKVALLRNFSQAAVALHISQPAISRSVNNLELELGQPLFNRDTRNVKLTDAGKVLYERALQILELIDSTKALVTDDGETGIIRLGAIPTIAPYYLPGFLKSFADDFPRATIHASEEVTHKLLERLKQSELDIAIMALPIESKYLDVMPLFKEELYLVTNNKHPLLQTHKPGKALDLSDVADYPFIMLDQDHCLSEQISSFCQQQSFQPLLLERASQLATVQELVSLGHGISLIPDMARHCDRDLVRNYIRLKNPQPTRTIVMVTNSYRYQTKLQKSCIKHLKKYGENWPKRRA